METPVYNKNKYYRIMDRTQSNYANQLKRLTKSRDRANFILIYYSLMLIINPLSGKFYPNLFDENWISYSGIILSTIVLIYSIINNKADYSARITTIQNALNRVKSLKRELGSLRDSSDLEKRSDESRKVEEAFDRIKKNYDELVNSTEVRADLDFFYTIRQLCKKNRINHITGKVIDKEGEIQKSGDEIEEIKGYISEINPIAQWGYIITFSLFHLIIYLIPIAILGMGIFLKNPKIFELLIELLKHKGT